MVCNMSKFHENFFTSQASRGNLIMLSVKKKSQGYKNGAIAKFDPNEMCNHLKQ